MADETNKGQGAGDKPQGTGGRPQGGERGGRRSRREPSEFIEKVIDIARVAKVVKGGRRFSFRAIVAIGKGAGEVGLGCGKSNEVMGAIQKAILDAKRNMITIKRHGTSIPHDVTGKFKAAKVLLKSATPGTGVIAGGAVRAIAECAGIADLLSKSMGSGSKLNIAKATFQALEMLRTREDIAAIRGKSIEEFKS